jgi:hypothetical protein
MTSLIACLSTGKGTWSHVVQLINRQQWDKVILITNEFGKEKFQPTGNVELIVTDLRKPVKELAIELKEKLKGKINDCEVALNLSSGTGDEHMAILSAVLGQGCGIRFVTVTDKGVDELDMFS